MKHFFLSASIIGLALASTLSANAATVTLPAGTEVMVSLVKPMNSGSAQVGQSFTFVAADPVMVAGHTLITKGALGRGHVVRVSKAQGKSAGELTLQFTAIHAADGSMVALTEKSSKKGNAEKGKASTATIAATIALGPLGLFAHNMVKGKDVELKPDQTFQAWVRDNTSVNTQ